MYIYSVKVPLTKTTATFIPQQLVSFDSTNKISLIPSKKFFQYP